MSRQRLLAGLLPAFLVLHHIYRRRRRFPRGIPTVPGHWLLGNIPEANRVVKSKSHLDWWYALHQKYGDTLVVNFPGQPPIVDTVDPKVVEHMLKTRFDNYIKGSWFRDRLTDLLGNGIFNVDGSEWHFQRKTASVMFTHNLFKNHIWRVVQANCGKVSRILGQLKPGETINMFTLMNRFTLDTIGEIGFGKSIGSLENSDSPFLKSFDVAQQVAARRFVYPLWQLQKLFGVWNEQGATGHFKLLEDYSRSIVRELRDGVPGDVGHSFVGLFMREAENKGEAHDEDFMKDMVLNFLIAGRDTTAHALSWCLFLLMKHPEEQERIVDEVQNMCGDRELLYDDTKSLPYLQAVINETLRLYPSVPLDSKVAVADDTLPDGTFVPQGCVVQFNPYCMGRSRRLWGEDAHEFRPERWIGRKAPSPYEYAVFNAGPRECLGKRLALIEMKAALCCILRSAKLTLAVPADKIRYDLQLTIGMSSGLPCRVEPR